VLEATYFYQQLDVNTISYSIKPFECRVLGIECQL